MLIFLDIDGVMVPAKGWKTPELLDDGFPAFSNRAVKALQKIISETAATVMLTSSHKSSFSINEWNHIFRNRGITVGPIKCLPENISNLNRKDELLTWFNLNNIVEDFIIVDDDKSLNDLPQYLKEHLIQTSSFIGLTEEHLEDIRKQRLKPSLIE